MLFKCLTTFVVMYFVCARASLLISVYLTFVSLGSRWAGIYPAATNAAGRKDETGDGEDMTVDHMEDFVCDLDKHRHAHTLFN